MRPVPCLGRSGRGAIRVLCTADPPRPQGKAPTPTPRPACSDDEDESDDEESSEDESLVESDEDEGSEFEDEDEEEGGDEMGLGRSLGLGRTWCRFVVWGQQGEQPGWIADSQVPGLGHPVCVRRGGLVLNPRPRGSRGASDTPQHSCTAPRDAGMSWDELEREAAREDRARHMSDEEEQSKKRKGGGAPPPVKRRR